MTVHWLITAGALPQLLSLTPDKAFVAREFDHPSTVVISPWRHPVEIFGPMRRGVF